MTPTPPFANQDIAKAYDAFAGDARDKALRLRQLIFETAEITSGVGPLDECLKWGQPAYVTAESGTGTTLRIGAPKSGGFGLYVHCQTTLIGDFRSLFPDGLTFDGNRGILFAEGQDLPSGPLQLFIKAALTYHVK